MEIFKQLKELGYKHYIDLTIEELDKLPIDNIERRIECSLVIDWFREKYDIHISIDSYNENENGDAMDYQYSYQMVTNTEYNKVPCEYFNSYEEAREQAILKGIELCQKEK